MSANNFPKHQNNHSYNIPPQKQQANAPNQQKRIPLIINHLHPKTHETTGNKPAKPEMTNKPNVTRNNQAAETNTSPTVTAYPDLQMHTTGKSE